MACFYLDASALIKYYIPERGSKWVSDLLTTRDAERGWSHAAITSLLSNVEGTCALERAHRSGRIDAASLDAVRRHLLLDLRERFQVLDANTSVVLRAVRLAQHHPLRAYDALHLATALSLGDQLVPGCVFVSADDILLAAARSEGLTTENPNDHP